MLTRGKTYTRREIHNLLGGGVQDYLPHKDGQVVCGCFRRWDKQPDAPEVILPGCGPEVYRWAEVFCEQKRPVPVFLKQASNCWEYVGDYVVDRWSEDPAVIAEQKRKTGRDQISRVLYLRAS